MHRGEEQERTALGEGSAVEQREHLLVVGDAPADGRIGGAAVALGHRREATEVVGQRLLDKHRVRSSRAAAG